MNKQKIGDYVFAIASAGFVFYNIQLLFSKAVLLIPLQISIGFIFLYLLAVIGSILLKANYNAIVCILSCIIWILIAFLHL